MKKINENTKVTLTLKQLKKLVKEAKRPEFEISPNGYILNKYNGPGGDVVIPDGVLSIGDHAFEDCTNLTSVTLHEVKGEWQWIGNSAFRGCSNLTSVNFPKLTAVDDYAFNGCTALKDITCDKASRKTILAQISGERTNDLVELGDDYEPPPCTAVINGKTRTFTNFDRFLKVLSKHLKPGIDKEDWLWWDMADFIDRVPGNEDKYFDGSVTKVTTPSIDEVMGLG